MRVALLVSGDLPWALSLARTWAAGADSVTVVLLDAAVAAARAGHEAAAGLREALGAGVAVAAEERALERRAMAPERLLEGVKVLQLDEVADLIAEGADKVLWL